jgi:hypothetical protein
LRWFTGTIPNQTIAVTPYDCRWFGFGSLVPGMRDTGRSFPRVLRWSASPLKGKWNVRGPPVFAIIFPLLVIIIIIIIGVKDTPRKKIGVNERSVLDLVHGFHHTAKRPTKLTIAMRYCINQ